MWYVNLHQRREDRKAKYRILRLLGFNSYEADRMRDWRLKSLILILENLKFTGQIKVEVNDKKINHRTP